MKKYKLYTALGLLNDFHGVTLDEDLFETYALSAYAKIGNKDCRLYVTHLKPQPDGIGGWFVQKPCNLTSIEAITIDSEQVKETDSVYFTAGLKRQAIEEEIEMNKYDKSQFYISGKLIKYQELGDNIYFSEPYDNVNVLYKGQYLDEDGLPYVNEKELNAIVAYCVYAVDQKQARLTKDPSTFQIAQQEYSQWLKACSQARVPEDISQNYMNEVLDVMHSWDVHVYNASSTKPRK